jgi:hypothetical protein
MIWLDKIILSSAIKVLKKYENDDKQDLVVPPDTITSSRSISRMRNQLAASLGNSYHTVSSIDEEDRDAHFNRDRAMNFMIHPAQGGYIVELRTYNSKTDRHDQQLHLISDDADLSESISKIITLELLRR